MHTIQAKIFVDIPEGGDPEDVATQMNLGLDSALQGFPAAEIVGASVVSISVTTPQEIEEEGLAE